MPTPVAETCVHVGCSRSTQAAARVVLRPWGQALGLTEEQRVLEVAKLNCIVDNQRTGADSSENDSDTAEYALVCRDLIMNALDQHQGR